MPERKTLTELQLSVLQILWQWGEAAVTDVQAALQDERTLALTTVATILSRLEKDGVVAHRTRGRVYLYRALVTRQEVRHETVRDILSTLFEGDATALVAYLLEESNVTADDIAKMQALIAAWEAQQESR